MQRALALPIALIALATGEVLVQAVEANANPLGQVIELLDSLSAKIVKEGETEAKAYKEFVAWCDDAAANKKFEIKTASSEKEELEAAIGKATGDMQASAAKVEELAGSIASAQAELKDATAVREKEAADFAANDAELTEVIDTLARAVAVIEREMAKNPGAFAQVDTSNLKGLINSIAAIVDAASFSSADKERLLALVQGSEADSDEFGAPAAAVYKTHSSSIMDVLEDLKDKAEEQLSGLRKAETNAKQNYLMLKQSLEDESAANTKDLEGQQAAGAAAAQAKAGAEGDLAETVKDLADAKGALELASSNCMQSAADHEASVKGRAEELETIAEAKKILQETTSGAASQTYSFLQAEAQMASRLRTRTDLENAELVSLIRKLAKENHSPALAQLASRIDAVVKYGAGAGEDPFAKVKSLISELIDRLEEEAGSEATEKAYCDEQLAKTQEKKGELEYDISKLTAKIDQASAKSATLKEEVQELQGELATLAKEQAAMDATRREGHDDFVQAKADLSAGLEGVRKALGLLREYYGGGASAAALLQGGGSLSSAMLQPAVPEKFAKAKGAGTSIIGILEVVESDFAKNLATAETEEDSAAAEYEKMSQANSVTKTLKDQDVKYKTQEFTALDKSIADFTGDRETTDAELSAVLEYYAKIKARCIAKPETYEARAQRRAAEIKGLKEALAILEDEAAFAQHGKRGLHGHFLGFAGQ